MGADGDLRNSCRVSACTIYCDKEGKACLGRVGGGVIR